MGTGNVIEMEVRPALSAESIANGYRPLGAPTPEGQLMVQSPRRAEAMTRELEEELQAYLERVGIVQLPGE